MAKVAVTFKAQTSPTYFRRVEDAIIGALEHAVDRTIAYGVSVAKRHAPVRKVTQRGGRGSVRDLTDDEIADLPDFAKKGLNPMTGNTFIRTGQRPQTTVKRSVAGRDQPGFHINGKIRKSPVGFRGVKQSRATGEFRATNPAFGGLLSVRGRYELKTGRAVSIKRTTALERGGGGIGRMRHGAEAQLGGTLKREIYGEMLSGGARDGIIRGEVRSPTDYARYVEFPTSRTAAQPYMRPARAAMDKRLPEEARRALEQVERFAGGGV